MGVRLSLVASAPGSCWCTGLGYLSAVPDFRVFFFFSSPLFVRSARSARSSGRSVGSSGRLPSLRWSIPLSSPDVVWSRGGGRSQLASYRDMYIP